MSYKCDYCGATATEEPCEWCGDHGENNQHYPRRPTLAETLEHHWGKTEADRWMSAVKQREALAVSDELEAELKATREARRIKQLNELSRPGWIRIPLEPLLHDQRPEFEREYEEEEEPCPHEWGEWAAEGDVITTCQLCGDELRRTN